MFKPALEPYFKGIICVTTALLLFAASVFPCSWDYEIWQIRSKNADALFRFVKGDRAGYIDPNGKVVIQPTLEAYGNYGGEFHDGLLLTGVSAGAYIDTKGKIALKTNLYRNWDFSEGLAAAIREGENKWGFIDNSGKFVIEPKFDSYPNGYVYSFSDGFAMVQVGKKYGFIGRDGEFVVQPQFPFAQGFNDGLAKVVVKGPCLLASDFFDTPCSESTTLGEFSDAQKLTACKYNFINKSGSLIAEKEFEVAKDFSEGLAAIQLDGKWGFIDKTGKVVIPVQFDRAYSFSDGLARVGKGDFMNTVWGYIDRSGKVVIPFQFERADEFSDGRAPVGSFNKTTREWGNFYYVNKSGERAFEGTFDIASHFYKGVAHVKLKSKNKNEDASPISGRYLYIDASGKTIFSYKRRDEDE